MSLITIKINSYDHKSAGKGDDNHRSGDCNADDDKPIREVDHTMSTIKIKVMITAMMTIQMMMTMINNNDDDNKPIREVDHTMSSSQDPPSTK